MTNINFIRIVFLAALALGTGYICLTGLPVQEGNNGTSNQLQDNNQTRFNNMPTMTEFIKILPMIMETIKMINGNSSSVVSADSLAKGDIMTQIKQLMDSMNPQTNKEAQSPQSPSPNTELMSLVSELKDTINSQSKLISELSKELELVKTQKLVPEVVKTQLPQEGGINRDLLKQEIVTEVNNSIKEELSRINTELKSLLGPIVAANSANSLPTVVKKVVTPAIPKVITPISKERVITPIPSTRPYDDDEYLDYIENQKVTPTVTTKISQAEFELQRRRELGEYIPKLKSPVKEVIPPVTKEISVTAGPVVTTTIPSYSKTTSKIISSSSRRKYFGDSNKRFNDLDSLCHNLFLNNFINLDYYHQITDIFKDITVNKLRLVNGDGKFLFIDKDSLNKYWLNRWVSHIKTVETNIGERGVIPILYTLNEIQRLCVRENYISLSRLKVFTDEILKSDVKEYKFINNTVIKVGDKFSFAKGFKKWDTQKFTSKISNNPQTLILKNL
jgi:hypothetical protein